MGKQSGLFSHYIPDQFITQVDCEVMIVKQEEISNWVFHKDRGIYKVSTFYSITGLKIYIIEIGFDFDTFVESHEFRGLYVSYDGRNYCVTECMCSHKCMEF